MRSFLRLHCLTALALCLSIQPLSAAKDRLVDLHHFDNGSDGYVPEAPPAIDAQDNIFGTTATGGGKGCGGGGCGVLYELSPVPGGGWTESILYSFQNGTDGSGTRAALARDTTGALYGSDSVGQFDEDAQIYRLTPNGDGTWNFSVLYVFDHTKGMYLNTEVQLIHAHGGLYGVTQTSTGGTLFKLTPAKGGATPWRLSTLFTFTDEGMPTSAVAALDGETIYVAVGNSVVSVSPPQTEGGTWTQTLLYTFTGGQDGEWPSYLVAGGDGAVYGTADLDSGRSIAFALTNDGSGWQKSTLQNFGFYGYPRLAWSPDGSLYGTSYGDQDANAGNAFRLDPPADRNGRWTHVELFNFRRGPSQNPIGLTLDKYGHVFGTLEGQYDGGAVFELRKP